MKHLGDVLKKKYGLKTDTVFMDWTSMFFEAPQKGIIRVGYSRDHRPDRPQVTIRLSMDRDTGMPAGLTVNAGNISDVTRFEDTFEQIKPLLPKDAMVVFDNGAYSKSNSAILDKANVVFVTRLQLNASDDIHVKEHPDDWITIDDDIPYRMIEGNLGRKRYLFRSNVRRTFVLNRYLPKAHRDYEEMETISKNTDKGKKPRKKYRNSNCFVDTKLSYQFPLELYTEEEAIDMAATKMTTSREGLFVLVTNRDLSAEEVLDLYRSRGRIEDAFRV